MQQKEVQLLSVLNAISLHDRASQRELSRVTGLNLAKVNYLLKRLADKGHVKLRNVSKNPNKLGYLYILTPTGVAEKSRLTMRFAARTWREYSETIDRFRQSLAQLVATGSARVVLLCANEVTSMLLEAGRNLEGLEMVAIVDPERAGDRRRGIPVVAALDGISFDRAILCDHEEEDSRIALARAGIGEDKLWLV